MYILERGKLTKARTSRTPSAVNSSVPNLGSGGTEEGPLAGGSVSMDTDCTNTDPSPFLHVIKSDATL